MITKFTYNFNALKVVLLKCAYYNNNNNNIFGLNTSI